MLAWGVTLLIVGLLSFFLPIFGKQFLLVTLLGFSGMAESVTGLLFAVVGALLVKSWFDLENEESRKRRASFSAKASLEQLQRAPDAHGSETPAVVERAKSNSSQKVADHPPQPVNGNELTVITERHFAEAEAGNFHTQFLVGRAYLEGTHGLPQQFDEAASYLLRSAEQKHPAASYLLAKLYANGAGVQQDFDKARACAMFALECGVKGSESLIIGIDNRSKAARAPKTPPH
jgi:hypothetical protein